MDRAGFHAAGIDRWYLCRSPEPSRMASPRPVRIAAVGSLALVPVVLYAIGRSDPLVAFSVVCVVLIAGSLYLMFGPAESESAPRAEPPADAGR